MLMPTFGAAWQSRKLAPTGFFSTPAFRFGWLTRSSRSAASRPWYRPHRFNLNHRPSPHQTRARRGPGRGWTSHPTHCRPRPPRDIKTAALAPQIGRRNLYRSAQDVGELNVRPP
jgi:hypothetical protein